jgi:hypothetical protein
MFRIQDETVDELLRNVFCEKIQIIRDHCPLASSLLKPTQLEKTEMDSVKKQLRLFRQRLEQAFFIFQAKHGKLR